LKAAALVDVEPADCWVIEDSLQGISSGLNAGMQVVGITTSHTATELTHTHLVAADFVDLFDKLQAVKA